jgi:LmbE family N-acetylglucosaminyl deacetylase
MSTTGGPNQPGQPGQTADHPATVDVNLEAPSTALAIGAHPDDIEFGCGATLAKWAAAGTTIHHLVCTDGSKGTWDPDADLERLRTVREHEQRAAAAILGGARAGEVRFLRRVDGELDNDPTTRAEVVRVLRELRPEVVLGHDPWKRYRLHPDHRAAGWLVCDAVVAARDPHFWPELNLAHHRPHALLLWEAQDVNHLEDVSTTIEVKLDALVAHRSQHETTLGAIDSAGVAAFRQRLRDHHARLGAVHGIGPAECFARIDDL